MTHTAYSTAGVNLFSGISAYVRSLRENYAAAQRRNRAYSETFSQLSAMSDRELGDIGISRFMIEDVAAEAAAMK